MDEPTLAFTVPGRPVPLKRHRSTRTGRMYDPSCKDKAAWLAEARPYLPAAPLTGPLAVDAVFRMPRPKSHCRTGRYAHLLKDGAPAQHTSTPDIDNLAKLVLDAMNGHFFVDDAQIVRLSCRKVYDGVGGAGGTDVRITHENT